MMSLAYCSASESSKAYTQTKLCNKLTGTKENF